jgi:nanoRNase/pAp phosphatase (c-di-AMP/oligoRNAs hydrolase)
MNSSFQQIGEVLAKHDSFVIMSHIRPDGDAIGSQLSASKERSVPQKTVSSVGTQDGGVHAVVVHGLFIGPAKIEGHLRVYSSETIKAGSVERFGTPRAQLLKQIAGPPYNLVVPYRVK